MSQNSNRGVFVCKGKRVHVICNDITLHFDFDEFEKFTFMLDDAYHRIKGEFKQTERDTDRMSDYPDAE